MKGRRRSRAALWWRRALIGGWGRGLRKLDASSIFTPKFKNNSRKRCLNVSTQHSLTSCNATRDARHVADVLSSGGTLTASRDFSHIALWSL